MWLYTDWVTKLSDPVAPLSEGESTMCMFTQKLEINVG